MALETQTTLTPTAKLFADNPQLARAVQIFWFSQIYYPDEITKTFAMLGVDPHRLALDDPASQRALLSFSETFFQKYPEENIRPQVEKVVPLDKTVETGLTYAEKVYAEAQRKNFVESLTDNYILQLKKQGVSLGDERAQKPAILKEVSQRVDETLKTSVDPQQITQRVQEELSSITGINATTQQAQAAAERATEQTQKAIMNVANQKNVVSAINNTILRSPAERKDVYARILTALSIKNPDALTTVEGTAHITQQASELEHIASTLSADIIPDPAKMGVGPEKFFASYAKTAVQKAAAPAADFLLKFVSPEKQWEIAETFLGKSFDRVMSNTTKLTEALGENFVGSPLYEYLQSQGRVALVERKGSVSSGMTHAKGLFDDLIGSVITGPIGERALGTPDDHMRDILKLNQMGVFGKDALGTPHPSPLGDGIHTRGATSFSAEFPSAQAPAELTVFVFHARDIFFSLIHKQEAGHHAFEFMKDLGGWLFHWGAKEGTKKAATEVAKKGATTAIGKVVGGAIGSLFGPVVGTWIGMVVGDIILDKVLGLIGTAWGGLRGLVSFSWITGAGGKSEWTDDVALVLAIVSVAFIPILLVYMLFTDVVRNSAYIEANQLSGGPIEEGPFPQPDYINFAGLSSFECLAFSNGVTIEGDTSTGLSAQQQARVNQSLDQYKQLSLISCLLGPQVCSSKIQLSRFTFNASNPNWYAWAPSAAPGNIILYPKAFTAYQDPAYGMAFLLAHELMHQVQYFNSDIYRRYANGTTGNPPGDCGFLGVYKAGAETSEERFAEVGAMYLMGNPRVQSFCGGATFAFFNREFSQCQ